MFEPDVLIAEVWGASQRRRAPLSSEKRLMLAVLQNAFECYQKYMFAGDRLGRQLFEEAATWINNTTADGLFSFESITEALDIEPEYFRRGLAEWSKRHLATQTGLPAPNPLPEPVRTANGEPATPPRAAGPSNGLDDRFEAPRSARP